MAITTGSFPKALLNAAVIKLVSESYKNYDSIIPSIFDMEKSSSAFEERVLSAGLGLARRYDQGESVQYDDMQQMFFKRFTHIKYATGFIVTEEMLDDDQAGVVIKMKAPELKKAYMDAREIEGCNIFNNAFSNTYTGADGKELCNSAHPTRGSTNSNILGTAADFSEAAVEAMINQMIDWVNLRGLRQMVKPDRLVCHPSLLFEVQRVLKSELRVNTAENDLNAIKSIGYLQGEVVTSPFFTDSDAWFVTTDVPNGFLYFDRKPMEVKEDNDFDTENMKFKVRGRFSMGWVNPLCVIGTPGA